MRQEGDEHYDDSGALGVEGEGMQAGGKTWRASVQCDDEVALI